VRHLFSLYREGCFRALAITLHPRYNRHNLAMEIMQVLKSKSPQASFYGSYLYDRIIPQDHLLRKINQVVDFSFVNELILFSTR
jgi:hypothetical protein